MSKYPNHASFTQFIETLLPPSPNQRLPTVYHAPRHPLYRPDQAPIRSISLHVTPTSLPNPPSTARPPPAFFIHRPFRLDRSLMPRGGICIFSHERFDELLTTGWNEAFGEDLFRDRCDVSWKTGLAGYKGDENRKIGMVWEVETSAGSLLQWSERVEKEFGGKEGGINLSSPFLNTTLPSSPNPSTTTPSPPLEAPLPPSPNLDSQFTYIVSLNAFTPEILTRVLHGIASRQSTPTPSPIPFEPASPDSEQPAPGSPPLPPILIVTGESREPARIEVEKLGISVLLVGHERCEVWGLRYLARRLKEAWPALEVQVVEEPAKVQGEERMGNPTPAKKTTEAIDE